eukprot:gnl/MRDRNA2_/MRDRNA2_234183_c0_seq1.p1 gnl/MRDRNA2_/MRDRNA2_234183_c0~~gnl/MRDRNA2_/MRDRNA2_234183_c0_seq1.p1  ORF type:complete len:375 (+),score=52.73 gnl/MRDRNA2_/MRDRNA2_234183_c0_seq1:129-1127(+)
MVLEAPSNTEREAVFDLLWAHSEPLVFALRESAEGGVCLTRVPGGCTSKHLLHWRCRWACGLGGMLSATLGLVERTAAAGRPVLVDWSDPELHYHGYGDAGTNLWEEFFTQPWETAVSKTYFESLKSQGEVDECDGWPLGFAGDRGTCQKSGILRPDDVARGRLLCQRFLWPQAVLLGLVQDFINKHLSSNERWLAVHVRRSDKAQEAPANLLLTESEIQNKVTAVCNLWGCRGILFCSDDGSLKKLVQRNLRTAGLNVVCYGARLALDSRCPTHTDSTIDGHRKAWDIIFEILLMAFGCHGLLSTYSSVSNAVIFYSPPWYPHCTFWDDLG